MTMASVRRFLDIVRLRYALQWAYLRRSSARLIWFVVIQVLMLGGATFAAIFGFGALVVAVQVGRAESIAQMIAGSIFANALVASVVFGFGLNQVFSDVSLRRFPFSYSERFVIRHLLGLTEPLWIITVAGYVGAAIAAALLGASPLWVALPAAVLLIASNYLLVRLILQGATALMETAIGSFIVFALSQLLFFIPMTWRSTWSNPQVKAVGIGVLEHTPPVAAGSLLAGGPIARPVIVLVLWCAGTAALLFWLDRRPDRSHTSGTGAASWNGPVDRLAAIFPAGWAPLVARSLRLHLRNRQVQYSFFGMLVAVAVMPLYFSRNMPRGRTFEFTLAMSPLLGTVTTAIMSNLFGYDGAGVRRLFLSPVSREVVLGATTLASMLIGGAYLLAAVALWSVVSPKIEPRMVLMLLTQALTGLFIFHGFAAWFSVRLPAKANYFEKFQRQPSPGSRWQGVIVLGLIGIPVLVRQFLPGSVLDYWWVSLLVAVAAAVFCAVSLKLTAGRFERRRERLLSVVEGRT